MKEKIKEIFKNRIFIFILGGLIFGSVGVTAATYFPSNDVTYDNTASGLSSTDVQGAIDELYNEFKGGNSQTTEQIKENVVTSGDGLYKDEYEDGKYIYKGGNPNNYIIFNNELWRILSIEKDNTIKIIKQGRVAIMAFDDGTGTTTGYNTWAHPVELNTYLNGTYYNGLSSDAKNQIASHSFNTGPYPEKDSSVADLISSENSEQWTGKIALITLSEFIRTNSNKSLCERLSIGSQCANTTWIDTIEKEYWWTITRTFQFGDVYYINGYGWSTRRPDGYSGTYTNNNDIGVRPVLYLSSNIKLKGSGNISNPYTIE